MADPGAIEALALPPLPFDGSRRLTGPNLHFAGTGAVLETLGAQARDPSALAEWRQRIERVRPALGWPAQAVAVRLHADAATLAFEAPVDQLFAATELNEWAWLAAVGERVLHAPGHPPAWHEADALRCLRAMCAAEAQPRLRALVEAAQAHGLPVLADDEQLSLGTGARGRSWALSALPCVDSLDWDALGAVPSALVTGSNGKTTTVRLLAAMLRAHGLRTGHSCTDGVFIDAEQQAEGDWSGPGGARRVLRDPRVQAAVLETARGGVLRRGLALTRADAACVTNISADHFGEYGIQSLDDIAEVKLTVARALGGKGVLVLNADDPVLAAHAAGLQARLAWFALDDAHPRLQAHRAAGGATCGLAAGVLQLSAGGEVMQLAALEEIPLAAGGAAPYNLGNAAAACLLANALGLPSPIIAEVLKRFGSDPADNPGRLQRFAIGGVQVLLDYAHNPDGLRGLLRVARAGPCQRLGLLLGQAGNRENADIRALARCAAEAQPDRVVLKDIDGYARGRSAGEVPALLADELRACGVPGSALQVELDEVAAAQALLGWARAGDVVVLPVHALGARKAVLSLIERLQGQPSAGR